MSPTDLVSILIIVYLSPPPYSICFHFIARLTARIKSYLSPLDCNKFVMIGDLMDALSDPRAFLSAQEKRMVQMKAMGIEETDIQAAANIAQSTRKEEEKKAAEDNRIEPISLDHLKNDKSFLKLLRKQQKELDSLKRKQEKEESSVQKQQCVAIEKIVKQNGKRDQLELAADPAVKEVVSGQIIQWTECLERHRIAEYEMQVSPRQAKRRLLEKVT